MKLREKKLIRRYLIWCYKTTQEELDRIDRKFTQIQVDCYVLAELKKAKYRVLSSRDYSNFLNDFQFYIDKKESEANQQKFKDTKREQLATRYVFLVNRMAAIEKAIVRFLGIKEKNEIECLYEEEMTRRILESREHT